MGATPSKRPYIYLSFDPEVLVGMVIEIGCGMGKTRTIHNHRQLQSRRLPIKYSRAQSIANDRMAAPDTHVFSRSAARTEPVGIGSPDPSGRVSPNSEFVR